MKLIVTTSDKYLHIVPIFIHLFQKYWGAQQEVELVGYKKPDIDLPDNFSFHSLGKQSSDPKCFGTDLRKYFSEQDDWIMWCMEDTFIKAQVIYYNLSSLYTFMRAPVGRISLTPENYNKYPLMYDTVNGMQAYKTPHLSEFRLSTMPAIWNKKFLLRYLQDNMSPWEFECQEKVVDEFENICFYPADAPVRHNEGVRKRDLYKYNFEGIDTTEMIQLGII